MTPLVFSIHDVMPSTLEPVNDLVSCFESHGGTSLTLLVVPGLSWATKELDILRRWEERGHVLAGHGWTHRCQAIAGIRHRLHSYFLSRNVAEHLCLDASEIVNLINDCFSWFGDQRLRSPKLYVPPAWALGSVARSDLDECPFPIIETLAGVRWTRTGSSQRLPLVGFEADTVARQVALSRFNQINRLVSRSRTLPLRVAIHPGDAVLRLRRQLNQYLQRATEGVTYDLLYSL